MKTSAAGTRPIAGRRLGDFVVHELVGVGGQGAVYRASQLALDREAVVKVLEGASTGPDGIERFLREARLASHLDHPYAAHVYAFGAEADGLLWIAMELVRGVTLADWLESEGPIPLERLAPLIERICEVVHTAHEQGIVHRDLKPGNIMVVSRAGRFMPKLLDFGIAKISGDGAGVLPPRETMPPPARPAPAADAAAATMVLSGEASAATLLPTQRAATAPRGTPRPVAREKVSDASLTGHGAALGSPAYMAPELWRSAAEAGERADIYALGALTYECLTGRAPFEERTLAALSRAHAEQPVPPLGADHPAALDAVLARALAKDPAHRYGDALDFSRDFARAAGFEPAAGDAAVVEVLDGATREAWMARAPAPLADVFPLLAAGRRPEQVCDALLSLTRALARYLGLLALACRARVSTEAEDSARTLQLLRDMRQRTLSAEEWVALARELTRPHIERRGLFPVPELVGLLHGGAEDRPLVDLLLLHAQLAAARSDAAAARAEIATSRPLLARLLGACEFLLDYRLVAARKGGAESWMGVQRFRRAVSVSRRAPLRAGDIALLDADGYPILSLAPLAQVAHPTPEAPEEIFVLDGGGTHGARLVCEPQGFERSDDGVWAWFAAHRLGDEAGRVAQARAERDPYRALAALTREDSDLYFGREREIDSMVNRLRVQPLVAVVGASGVGKSSFVQAGVVAALGATWQVATFRPGAQPMAQLSAALDRLAGAASALLVVDQLEEMFTLCGDERERERFAVALVEAAGDRVRVVVTLRDDFLVVAEQLPAFRGLLSRGMQLLTTPHEEDLVRILEEPARLVGYSFEDPELPREMVREVSRRRGALALLSFAAASLWERRDRRAHRLTRAAHVEIGGVTGALAKHADAVVEEMPADQRPAVRELFQQLFTAQGTRAVRQRADLLDALGGGSHEKVLDRLIAARLLVSAEEDGGMATVEVAHEALLHAWPRLAEWRREDAESIRRREELQEAARQWRDRGRDRALLWRGDLLSEYALWRKGSGQRLGELETQFLDEGLREAARGRRVRRALAVGAVALVSVAALLLLWANRRTEAERRVAVASAAEARTRLIDLRFEQARQAHLTGSSLQALAFLREAFASVEPDVPMRALAAAAMRAFDLEVRALDAGRGIISVRFAAGGARVVTAGWTGPPILWDAATGARVRTLDELPDGWPIDVSDDGRLVAIGSTDGAALWDAETGRLVARYAAGHAVACVDLSADAGHLLLGREDGVATVEALAGTGRGVEMRVPDGGINACGLARDAEVVLLSSQQPRLFDARTGRLLRTLRDEAVPLTRAELAPDGTRVVVYWLGRRGVELWDVRAGTKLAELRGHVLGVFDAAFSADGRRLATAGRDRSAKVWDVEQGALVASLPHPSEVIAVAFDPAGTRLASTCGDQRVRLWQAESGRIIATMEGHLDVMDDLAFSPDGSQVVSASRDGTAKIWRSITPGLVRELGEAHDLVAATFSADGGTILAYSSSGRATLWDAASGARLREIEPPAAIAPVTLTSPLEARLVPALDPHGQRAALPVAERIALVDTATGRATAWLDHGARVASARFSPDGSLLATGDAAGAVRIWRLDDPGASPRFIEGHTGRVGVLAFSPDGTRLASGDWSGALRVTDVASGEAVYTVGAHPAMLLGLAFSPDGGRIATGGLSRPVKVWSASRPELVASFETAAATLGIAYTGDGTRLVAIHGNGQATVWDTSTSRLIDRIGIGGDQGHWVEVSPAADRDRVLLTSGPAELWDITPYRGSARELADRLGRLLPYTVDGKRVVRTGVQGAR